MRTRAPLPDAREAAFAAGRGRPAGPLPDAMFARLLLLFTAVPLVELYLLIEVGSVLGGFQTILLVLGTGVLGAFLARMEGLRTLGQIHRNLNRGVVPAEEMVDGVIILAAGLLLVTPGILTDACGFLMLVPAARTAFKRWLRRRFDRAAANVHIHTQGGPRHF